jgi:hypothetical protein
MTSTNRKRLTPEIRIARMEEIFDKALDIMARAMECPEEFLAFQGEIRKLDRYYTGSRWKKDFELDEQGKLPKDLKRGVLSEDGIYNLLERNKELLEEIEGEAADE